jgi:hypothetical protein
MIPRDRRANYRASVELTRFGLKHDGQSWTKLQLGYRFFLTDQTRDRKITVTGSYEVPNWLATSAIARMYPYAIATPSLDHTSERELVIGLGWMGAQIYHALQATPI